MIIAEINCPNKQPSEVNIHIMQFRAGKGEGKEEKQRRRRNSRRRKRRQRKRRRRRRRRRRRMIKRRRKIDIKIFDI